MSFAVIGWQSSALTSWNWSWGASEEILQHVGFHVMAMCCSACQWVEIGQKKRSQSVVPLDGRSPRYPSTLETAKSKTWRYRVSRGIKKHWQINHGWAGIPLTQLIDISFYGHFAHKVWSQRQAWDPQGNVCGIAKEEPEVWEHANVSCSQLKHHPTWYFEHL